MNQGSLEGAIDALRVLANNCETSRDNIVRYYNDDGNTLEEAGYREPDDFYSAASSAIQTLRDRATTIEKYKDSIVELNESGVASMDADGIITLELPDDATFPEDPKNFASWAQAVIDADDLKNALSQVPERRDRTYDDIIASIRAHSSDPAYADAIIMAIGPEKLTDLPLYAGRGKYTSDTERASADLASLFGTLVASASTGHGSWPGWSESKCQEVADAIKGSVDDSGEYKRLPILNCIFGDHDADGDHVNDLKFNRYLLVDLAEALDDIDIAKVREGENSLRLVPFSFHDDCYSYDPIAGVLDAMGNNRFAALAYFAPSTDDGNVDTSRIDDLSTRDWDQLGLAGFAAALAAGSSLRSSTVGNQANRATELAGHAIDGLAENTKDNVYNDDAKANMATLLANCRNELVSALGGDGGYDTIETEHKLPGGVSGEDFLNLSYRLVDNEDAVATLSASIGEWAHQASQVDIANNAGSPDIQMEGIENRYQQASAALAFLAGMADDRAETATDQKEDEVKASSDNAKLAFSVFATVATAGLGAVGGPLGSTTGKTAMSVGTMLLAPVIARSPKVQDVASAASIPDLTMSVKAAAIAEAANAGLLDPADYNEPGNHPGAFSQYGWLRPNGADPSQSNINLAFGSNIIDDERDKSDPTDDQVETPSQQVVHWAEMAYQETHDERLRELTNSVIWGKSDRYVDGSTARQHGVG